MLAIPRQLKLAGKAGIESGSISILKGAEFVACLLAYCWMHGVAFISVPPSLVCLSSVFCLFDIDINTEDSISTFHHCGVEET
jgi:hypothetical protein